MVYMSHVHSDLMGTSCQQMALNESMLFESLSYVESGYGILAVLIGDSHLLAVLGISADWRIDRSVIVLNDAMNKRIVLSAHGLVS